MKKEKKKNLFVVDWAFSEFEKENSEEMINHEFECLVQKDLLKELTKEFGFDIKNYEKATKEDLKRLKEADDISVFTNTTFEDYLYFNKEK